MSNTTFRAGVIFWEGLKGFNGGFENTIMFYFLTWWWVDGYPLYFGPLNLHHTFLTGVLLNFKKRKKIM